MSRLQIVCLVELLLLDRLVDGVLKPREQATDEKKWQVPGFALGIFLVMVGFALAWAYVRPAGSRAGWR